MKKNYITPKVLVIHVETQRFIADSQARFVGLEGFGGYGGSTSDSSIEPASRSCDWDDFEDDGFE